MSIANKKARDDRANDLAKRGYNGIKMIIVEINPGSGAPPGGEATLGVHFYNDIALNELVGDVNLKKFSISGGQRIPAGPLEGQVHLTKVEQAAEANVLNATVSPIGDYSTYTLSVVDNTVKMDPLFSEMNFKFRPGCFNTDCAPEWGRGIERKKDPVIDYLAKDFDSFRHSLIAAMGERTPNWKSTSEADLDQTLLELFCAAADELSDFQDRVMNEAYFVLARKRVSLARHARLMDYHIHQGNQAHTWLALETKSGTVDAGGEFQVWAGREEKNPSSIIFLKKKEEDYLFLFTFSGAFIESLDTLTISDELRNEFASHGISLSDMANVEKAQGGGAVWTITDTRYDRQYQIEKTMGRHEVAVRARRQFHHLLNQIGLYTWSDSIPGLAAGSVHADLKLSVSGMESCFTVQNLFCEGNAPHLLAQERLNPTTGREAGADSDKRQLLQLLPGKKAAKAMQDPVTGEWFVRVWWEEKDKLKRNYCFTVAFPDGNSVEDVSVFHANLAEIYHGDRVTTVFIDPETADQAQPDSDALCYERIIQRRKGETARNDDPRQPAVICRLPAGPLAYRPAPAGGETPPVSTLEVEVTSSDGTDKWEWEEVISLVKSDSSDENGDHFVVETDEEGRSLIRFGDGVNGKPVPAGAEIHCAYQIGRGASGNVGADTLVHLAGLAGISKCWNPFSVTTGKAPEPVAEIIRRVPEFYRRRQLRAVTLRDYEQRVEELPEVSRASARYSWTGSWRTVRISVDPAGVIELSEELRKKIVRHLATVGLIGEDVEIRSPLFVPLEIQVSVCALPNYWPEDISYILSQEFSSGYTPDGRMGFFHPDLWTFGRALHESEIIGRAQTVVGVERVASLSMRRWNNSFFNESGVLEAGSNEILLVQNDPDHMEKGFIFFKTGGGRR